MGGLDILVNNAGVGLFADVADMTPQKIMDALKDIRGALE